MAPPTWMLALAAAACAPRASQGIRQEAATELLALPLAQVGSDVPSSYSYYYDAPSLDLSSATLELGRGGREGSRMHAAWELLAFPLAQEGGDVPSSLAEQRRESEAAPLSAPPGASHRGGHPTPVYHYDKDMIPCYYDGMNDDGTGKFVYVNGAPCQREHLCQKMDPHGWVDPFNNFKPCGPPATSGSASAMDDPHLVSLAGERFDVNRPGQYSLLQVPSSDSANATAEGEPLLLALEADLRVSEGSPCGLYIKMVALSGRWLDGKVARIRPSSGGGGGGGAAQQRPLSVQVAGAEASEAALEGADERPWAPFGGQEANESLAEASTRMVRALGVRREELGPFGEGQAFRFELLGSGSGQGPPASITVSQGSHRALNVALEGMAGLGHARLGGLLGTEPHDHGLEVPTEECRERRAHSTVGALQLGLADAASRHLPSSSLELRGGGREGSRMHAAWE